MLISFPSLGGWGGVGSGGVVAFTRSASRTPRWHGRKQLTGWGGGLGGVVAFTRSASRIPRWHGRKQLTGWGGWSGVVAFTRSASRIPHWHGRKQLTWWGRGGGWGFFVPFSCAVCWGQPFQCFRLKAVSSSCCVLAWAFCDLAHGLETLCMPFWDLDICTRAADGGLLPRNAVPSSSAPLVTGMRKLATTPCMAARARGTVDAELFSASRNDAVSSIARAAAQVQHDFQSLLRGRRCLMLEFCWSSAARCLCLRNLMNM